MPLHPNDNPLGPEHLQAVNAVLASVAKAEELSQVCHDCGWDVSGYKQALAEQKAMAEAIKRHFFPHAP